MLPDLGVSINHCLVVLSSEISSSSDVGMHHIQLHLNIVIVRHTLFIQLFEIDFLSLIKLMLQRHQLLCLLDVLFDGIVLRGLGKGF